MRSFGEVKLNLNELGDKISYDDINWLPDINKPRHKTMVYIPSFIVQPHTNLSR